MKVSLVWRRLLALLLVMAVMWAQTGAVVAVSLDAPGVESEETETPQPMESQTTPEESEPSDEPGLGVEVVERPDTDPEEISPAPAPEESPDHVETAPPKPSDSAVPEESSAPEAEKEPAQGIETLPEIVERPLESPDVSAFLDEETMPLAERTASQLFYRLGYGVDFEFVNDIDMSTFDEYTYIKLSDLGGKFTAETRESVIDWDTEKQSMTDIVYGYRNYSWPDGRMYRVPYLGDKYGEWSSFCIFPSEETMGRVPDQEFAGWYLYPASSAPAYTEGENPKNTMQTWKYDESIAMVSLEDILHPYGPSDPKYSDLYEEYDGMYSDRPYSDLGGYWDGGEYDFYTEHGYGTATGEIDPAQTPVSIVGRWVPSSQARAAEKDGAALKISGQEEALALYGEDIAGKASPKTVVFSPEKTEYWLRVDADVTALDLTFNAYELYYDYHQDTEGKPCPVTVTSTFGGRTTTYTDGLSQKLLPEEIEYTLNGLTLSRPGNSVDDPAHSEWTVKGIALTQSAGKDSLYNDIQVTVTSPDGEVETTYTFHVQRLTEPTATQTPGNTPVGMIQRDTSAYWGTTMEEIQTNKARACEYFETNRTFDFASEQYPQDYEHNQGGSIFRGTYTRIAWLGETEELDIDLDPTAIVIYQDAAFLDPGIALTDAEGNPVSLSGGAVKRTLRLRGQASLSLSGVGDGLGTTVDLSGTVSVEGGRDQIDLRGRNILPGIYTMEYTYDDPISGKTYNSAGDGFVTSVGAAGKSAFARTVVVLPVPGDVDMDGAVTSADAVILDRNLGTNMAGRVTLNGRDLTQDRTAALFAYRVCDQDQNGTLDESDVNLLEQLPSPRQINVSESDYYYIPLPTGEEGEHYPRLTLEEQGGSGGAVVSMEYLGKERGIRSDAGYYTSPSGPWSSNPSEDQKGVTLEDTFWLGVKLTDGRKSPGLNQSVQTFTFSLTYDARYVKPAIVLSQEDWQKQDKDSDRWGSMMAFYNMGNGSNGRTVWGNGYSYRLTQAADRARPFTTHYSKAITPLEANAGVSTQLQELVFSVELDNEGLDGVTLSQEGSVWLFAVPFILVRHPYGQTNARLVEMGAGMDGFTVVGKQTTAASNGIMNLVDVVGRQGQVIPVAAYSSQTTIFGGSTRNLHGSVSYESPGAYIPLGEDKTEINLIYNELVLGSNSRTQGVYAEEFSARGGWASRSGERVNLPTLSQTEVPGLPKGLEYTGFEIKGIPEEAGVFEFYVGEIPFRLVIEKAPLHFWADNQVSYYAQPEFRGRQSPDFTFSYAVDDIKSFDRKRAEEDENIHLDGKGVHLKDLLADEVYNNKNPNGPAFTAVTSSGGTPVANTTGVGTYTIQCPLVPESSNYEFMYTPTAAPGGYCRLTIMARPYLVSRIAPTNVGLIYTDETGVLINKEAELKTGKTGQTVKADFSVELPHSNTDQEGYYGGLPLTKLENCLNGVLMPEDSLKITYDATYVRTTLDESSTGGHFFTLTEGNVSEERNILVSNIELENAGRSNYRLVSGIPIEAQAEGVVGTVTRRNVKRLNIEQLPPMEYQYGARLTNSNELQFYLELEGGGQAGIYAYNDNTQTELGISITWALPEEREAYLHPEKYPDYTLNGEGERWTPDGWTQLVTEKGWDAISYARNQLFDLSFDGRYLCMSIQSADSSGHFVVVRQYSKIPLTVTARVLTLTATPAQRFYGEENGELAFTYRPEQLAACDSAGRVLTGKGAELAEILAGQNYTPPTLKAVDSVETRNELGKFSNYGQSYAVMIYGAKSDNYQFEYVFNQGGSSEIRKDMGVSNFSIQRRPIVVDAVIKTEPLVTIFADTHKITLEDQTLTRDEVKIGLPSHTETTTEYYPRGGISSPRPIQVQAGYAPDSPAILEGDDISFTYTATVVSIDGANYVKYRNFANGYFNMDVGVDESYGGKEYPVQVSNLRLAGASAGNYTLVFRDNNEAILSLPTAGTGTTEIRGIEPERSADRAYYVPKTSEGGTLENGNICKARVILRSIESIEIVTPGKLIYTYGEIYRPDAQQGLAMQIKISYTRNEPEDTIAGNPTEGYVTMAVSHYGESETFTTFDDRSLVIYWMQGEDTEENREAAIRNGQVLKYQENLQVDLHDGAKLFITGKRGAQTNLVVSKATQETLKVSPKVLTLTADDKYRSYGERNGEFSFTFNKEQLASADQEKLRGYSGAMDDNALQYLGRSGLLYNPPTVSTTATQDSSVLSDGQGGYRGYPITVSGGGLSNYSFEYKPGNLYVYPRMIKIDGFESSKDKPIYTIFASMQAHNFTTSVTTRTSTDQPSARMSLPNGNLGYTLPDGTRLSMEGSAIYGDDELTLTIQVQFPEMTEDELKGQNGQPVTAQVISAKLESGLGSENYILEQSGSGAVITNSSVTGKVELRSILDIEFTGPSKLTYTYGEELDLSDLVVTIHYNVLGGESNQSLSVRFLSTEQFASNGLYVNYYPSDHLPSDSAALKSIKDTYPKASTGDHLTIAPTHETQGLPISQQFSANGKYLVITALRNEAQDASVQMVGNPIKVNPLALNFSLAAEDKTYDDSTEAAGTLTLDGVYRNTGVVDMVYPVTGADYEEKWTTLAGGAATFNEYVNRNGYSFRTGTYRPAAPAPLGENYPLSRPDGYEYGKPNTLTFTFVDSNVRYKDETAAANGVYGTLAAVDVEVTGIRLAGPDAPNYTIAGVPFGSTASVTRANANSVEGYKDMAVPSAVIHRRNRSKLTTEFAAMPKVILPLVELDVHTNVVRVNFDRALSTIPGALEDTHTRPEELHYEYALQYNTSTEEQAAIGQWAGRDGSALWGDTVYFGGEAVRLDLSELIQGGYVPKEEDIPQAGEEGDLKGQVYRWSGEDEGFRLDPTAYPGSPTEPWPGYTLYTVDRTGLEREKVYLPLVRVAESHNYNASPPISSVEGYTPELIQEVQEALSLLENSAGNENDYEQAKTRMDEVAKRILPTLEGTLAEAERVADAEMDQITSMGEGENQTEWTDRPPAPAVRTYRQRIEAISVKELQSEGAESGREGFLVPTLEAVWFTDVWDYPKREVLDAVLHNSNPVRYRGYAWDRWYSAELNFEDAELPIRLETELLVPIKRKENGQEIDDVLTVNVGHNAQIYVDISSSSGGSYLVRVESITIDSGDITVVVGEPSKKLTATIYPANSTNRGIRWSSSDSSVVEVSRDGTLTFVGVGTAVITATSVEGVSDSIIVIVMEDLQKTLYPNSIFEFQKVGALFDMDEDLLFGPEREMTRGEVAQVLSRLYIANPNWTKTGPEDFPDLTGEEDYAEAARLLGGVGVMTGLPGGIFGGDQYMTRAEFVAILVRMMGLEVPDTRGQEHAFLDTFEDTTGVEGTWAYAEIDAMSKVKGILQGVGDSYFAPRRNITRAEAAVFLNRLLQFSAVPEKDILIPRDVGEEHWARKSILRAVNQGVVPSQNNDC